MKRLLLVLAFLTSVAAGRHQAPPETSTRQRGIPFEVNREFGTILVHAVVNGRPATLVVDMGSNRTILSSDIMRAQPDLKVGDAPLKGSGRVGSGIWSHATVELGTLKWSNHQVLVMSDFPEISKNMKEKIDGILGEDLLREFDVVSIDFKRRRLLLLHCGDTCDPCIEPAVTAHPEGASKNNDAGKPEALPAW